MHKITFHVKLVFDNLSDRKMKNEHYKKMRKDALAGLARKKRKGKISPQPRLGKYFDVDRKQL